MQHVFIVGAKSIGQYGGYETFLDKLIEQHENNKNIQYHIITKANGDGFMDETKLENVKKLDNQTFIYRNARVTKLQVPQIGAAQAIIYDIKALEYCIQYVKANQISNPIYYVLACRIGPFIGYLTRKIHKQGGKLFVNPDGHEWKRAKWNKYIRKYWKISEQLMVKHADLLVCDSINIEKYIKTEYKKYNPQTCFIAYGSDIRPSKLEDNDSKFQNWMKEKGVKSGQYYMCCGRFVPENSFEIMIREFMMSKTAKDFVLITTDNKKFLDELDEKLHFSKDSRIKFVGTVYDSELLKKIRENAYANFHGHTVGGTNPSLLEALGSTKLNLLINVGFNREVAQDSALYWEEESGSLSTLINEADELDKDQYEGMGVKAKKRISEAYSWEFIASEYQNLFG